MNGIGNRTRLAQKSAVFFLRRSPCKGPPVSKGGGAGRSPLLWYILNFNEYVTFPTPLASAGGLASIAQIPHSARIHVRALQGPTPRLAVVRLLPAPSTYLGKQATGRKTLETSVGGSPSVGRLKPDHAAPRSRLSHRSPGVGAERSGYHARRHRRRGTPCRHQQGFNDVSPIISQDFRKRHLERTPRWDEMSPTSSCPETRPQSVRQRYFPSRMPRSPTQADIYAILDGISTTWAKRRSSANNWLVIQENTNLMNPPAHARCSSGF